MKKLIPVLLVMNLLLSSHQTSYSQISKQDAIDLVVDTLFSNCIDSVSIFMDSSLLSKQYYKPSPYDSILSPYSEYWLFFIDKQPWNLAWGHNCSYVFVNKANGDYKEVDDQIGPFLYYSKMEHVSVTFDTISFYQDFSNSPYNFSFPAENKHLFALVFAVTTTGKAIPYVWNNLSHTYLALRNNGFPDENIYILYNDGVAQGDSTSFPSLDLDDDGNEDILKNLVCNVNNMDSILKNVLKENMDEDDLLFMYSYCHGTIDTAYPDVTHLGLWENEPLYDSVLAPMIEQVNCSEFVYVNESCHGGGIIDDFSGVHQTIITPMKWGESVINPQDKILDLGFSPYTYAIITSLRGEHPYDISYPWLSEFDIGQDTTLNDHLFFNHLEGDFNPDSISSGDSDGTIQMNEAIVYCKTLFPLFDSLGEYIYNSGFQEIDDLLSITGISGHIDTTQTVYGNFIVGGDLTLNDSSTLTIDDNSKFFFISGDFHTQVDSELILEDSILFKNYQETDSIVIKGDFEAGTGNSFEAIDSTTMILMFDNEGLDAELSDCNFENVSLYGYTDTLTVNSSSNFTNSRIRGAVHLIVDSTTFTKSTISMMAPGFSKSTATITNSNFSDPHPDENNLVSLYRFATYHITGDTFTNWKSSYSEGQHSVAIEYSGTTGPTAMNNINENVFVSSRDGYSNTNGILVYASIANIYNNNIQDQNVGVMLTGRSQSILAGTSDFCNEETQVIKNNNITQVYASEYSFPTEFIWNAIYHDTLTKCFVHHDIDTNYQHHPVNVTLNYWSDQYDPYNNLIPLGHFEYDSIYNPCGKNATAGSSAENLYQSGLDQIANGNYLGAKNTFEELINDFPDTEQANFAMKDIFNLEPLTDNDFLSLKSYYLSADSIIENERLEKLGHNLANKCDKKLGNFSNAIDWYEDMIEDPPTLQDSVFAIIDLENCYFQMGIDTSLKSSAYVGRYPQYKQKTVKAHQDHRDKLLALLLKQSTLEEENNTETDNYELSKLAELKQNIPNPFKSSTQISYSLSIDSDVQLTVYNYNGQKLKTINEGFKPKGTYTTVIDASGLQSGIYFYTISVNGHTTDSKKLTVIK